MKVCRELTFKKWTWQSIFDPKLPLNVLKSGRRKFNKIIYCVFYCTVLYSNYVESVALFQTFKNDINIAVAT